MIKFVLEKHLWHQTNVSMLQKKFLINNYNFKDYEKRSVFTFQKMWVLKFIIYFLLRLPYEKHVTVKVKNLNKNLIAIHAIFSFTFTHLLFSFFIFQQQEIVFLLFTNLNMPFQFVFRHEHTLEQSLTYWHTILQSVCLYFTQTLLFCN